MVSGPKPNSGLNFTSSEESHRLSVDPGVGITRYGDMEWKARTPLDNHSLSVS